MIYTVHLPRDIYDPAQAAERARFVRDGFSVGAFVFGPLWFLWHRAWLGLLIDLVLMAAAFGLARLAMLPLGGLPALLVARALLMGFEGPSLVRWSADRGRYRCVDVVSAASREEAEHQFLRRFARRPPERTASAGALGASDVPFGLFPEETG